MSGRDLAALGRRIAEGHRLDDEAARHLAERDDLDALLEAARAVRDAGFGDIVTVSRKVFVPLTKLCRDACGYCTFAQGPKRGANAYLTPDDVMAIAEAGRAAGCDEVLFTLGDKPELRYRAARDALDRLGHPTTLAYLAAMAKRVLGETGLLPHLNPGLMDEAELRALRTVSASQGIMLETTADRLSARGGPHEGAPDKVPALRLATIAAAGRAHVPFTSGILIGIGETRAERIDALLALRSLHETHGHIQEIIVQNFRAKPRTRMAKAPEPSLDDHLWTIAVARLILGSAISVQAPPNLAAGDLPRLVEAGIDDWGGVSPVTPDHVNPERPWPALARLAEATAAAGKTLAPRLAVYPRFARAAESWLDAAVRPAVLARSDALGFAQESTWRVGAAGGATPLNPWHPRADRPLPSPPPLGEVSAGERRRGSAAAQEPSDHVPIPLHRASHGPPPPAGEDVATTAWRSGLQRTSLDHILARATAGETLDEADIVALFSARGRAAEEITTAADELRRKTLGDEVTYVVTRNINYTNVCSYGCRFCAFSKGRGHASLRGRAYDLDLDEIVRRAAEAWGRGATEVCLQGGIHPDYTGETYLQIVAALKQALPGLHVHAFSALEVSHGAETLGLSVDAFLGRLREAGLGTLPGTAAEILDDEVRRIICPDKLSTDQWLGVIEAAHRRGLRTTSTIMFGHVDRPVHWARHLLRLRALQARTGGITEFVPLPFVHREAPMALKGQARHGPSFREAVLMHAVARLALHPVIPNVQVSWVKMGPAGVAAALGAGANDLGGTLMNESISRAAGAEHGQEMPPEAMEAAIAALERMPRQRTTLYGAPAADRVAASYNAAPLSMVVEPAAAKHARIGSRAGQLQAAPGS